MISNYISYSDAGGDDSSPFMTVGGLISKTEDWKSFNREWAKILMWAKVPYLHMKQFVARREPFKNKKWERKELREKFMKRLIILICKHVDFRPSMVLDLNDWKTVNSEYRLKEDRLTPFAVTGLGYVAVVEEWCKRNLVPWEHMAIVYEFGDDGGKGHFEYWCKKAFNKTPIPQPGIPKENEVPSEYPLNPLQACDLVAWEVRHAETGFTQSPNTYTFRRSYDELLLKLPSYQDHEKWSVEALRNFCRRQGVKKR